MSDLKKLVAQIDRAIRYLENDAKTIIGVEATNHFKESFPNQGFTDSKLEKWEEVERRKSGSSWKGYQYGSNASNGKKRRKPGSPTNYSPAAETRPILSGPTGELMNSIQWEKTARGVRVYAATAYAKIQNEGGPIKIFGKTSATMPKRQFMGPSKVLTDRIKSILLKDLKQILR
jgi:phage gpG-like protein